jgi:hypothetical protein
MFLTRNRFCFVNGGDNCCVTVAAVPIDLWATTSQKGDGYQHFPLPFFFFNVMWKMRCPPLKTLKKNVVYRQSAL